MDPNTPLSWADDTAYNNYRYQQHHRNHSEWESGLQTGEAKFPITLQRVALSVVPLTLTFCTILGNVFVIVAVCINSRISRRNTTILVLNLAVADLFVGSVIMPISVLQILTGGVWMLSRFTCKVWTSLDVISCTASIVTLCVISVERFVGVTRPLEYCYLVTKRRLGFAVLFVWLYSFTVLLATVRWHNDNDGIAGDNSTLPASSSEECNVGGELKYVMQSVMFSFFIPLFVILLVYRKIYQVIRRRESNLLKAVVTGNIVQRRIKLVKRRSNDRSAASRKSSSVSGRLNLFTPLRMHYGGITSTSSTAISNGSGANLATAVGCNQSDAEVQKQRNFFQKQLKTAKTLGVVVGAFVVCWLPFFILYLIRNMCNSCYIPEAALEVFSWLGYGNSALNPVIYAVSMRTFANTFRHICHCCPCSCMSHRRSLCRMSASRCSMQRRKSTATMRSSVWSRSESTPDIRRVQLCRPSQAMLSNGGNFVAVDNNGGGVADSANSSPNCHDDVRHTYSAKSSPSVASSSKTQRGRRTSNAVTSSVVTEDYQNGAASGGGTIPIYSCVDFKCKAPASKVHSPSATVGGYNRNYVGARLSTERMFHSNVIEL